jgi:hypothetical protein
VLPSDRYIASVLGLTDEQYLAWKDYLLERAHKGPQPAVVAGEPATTLAITSLVLTAIGVGFQIIAFLLQPRVGNNRPAELKVKQRTGVNQLENSSFAPRAGFDAIQEVAGIGAPIPVLYTKRETLDGYTYGGVRTNTSLLWSQIWSLGGSQMLRAVFLLGEGDVEAIDLGGFAIGDNSIGGYDLAGGDGSGSRLTIYYRSNGGRLTSADRILGRLAANDNGNAQNDGASDVFQVQSLGNAWAPDFCASIKPSTNTTFGVYSPIGNNLGYKLNPVVRPKYTARLKPKGDEGNAIVACDVDEVVATQRAKYEAFFSTKSGIVGATSGSVSYAVGDTFTYTLYRSSDFNTEFSGIDDEDDTWTMEVEVREIDTTYIRPTFSGGFPGLSSAITPAALEATVTLGTPTVDTINKRVTSTVTVDDAAIIALYRTSGNVPAPGSYHVDFWLRANNTSRDLELRQPLRVVVVVREYRLYARDSSGDNFTTLPYSASTVVNGIGITSDFKVDIKFPEDAVTTSATQADIQFDYSEKDLYTEKADDAASAVAARQRTYDDAIVVGELYKVGSALAVCTARTPDDALFISDFETLTAGSGQSISATFEVVRAGQAAQYTQADLEADGLTSTARAVGSSGPHLMRVALANLVTSRECRIVELGIRSAMGVSISGLLRFRNTLSFQDADNRGCLSREGDKIKRGNTVKVDQYQSGTSTTIDQRYSFFRISYRRYSDSTFTPLDQCFGVRGITQQAMFNYIRLEMPYQDRWEYRIEPLTAWEIRQSIATGELCVLDSKLQGVLTKTTTTGGVTVTATFNGVVVSRARSTFRLTQTRRDASMGLPYPDDFNYADSWGRLAEQFIYEEIQATASNSPEHEIVYVNEILENDATPLYPGMALIGINVRSMFEWTQFRQLSAYITAGAKIRRLLQSLTVGASHLFPDIALDRLTNPKYGPGRISDDLIDLTSFQEAAQWCQDRRYFFDGPVMLATDSPRQWIADTAATMLLSFREVNGSYSLAPALTFDPAPIKALFTAGNIEEGSFRFETVPVDDRTPTQISVRWREERSSTAPTSPGLFPVEREVLVREAGVSDTAPVESVDLTGYVTSEAHAIDVAKFKLRNRSVRTHLVSFTTTYDGIEAICSGIKPGDYIRVAMDTTVYDEFSSGAVTTSGQVISTTDVSAGGPIIAWDGSEDEPWETDLVVAEDGTATPRGIVFVRKVPGSEVKTYEITSITPTDDGKFDIAALHAPTDPSGYLEMIQNWDDAGSWEIVR